MRLYFAVQAPCPVAGRGDLTNFGLALRVLLLGLLVLGGVILVVYGTRVRNKWGINSEAARCFHCNAPAPGVRMPKNLREFLWGGWTCSSCGTHVDKWGRELGSESRPTRQA